MHLHDKYIEAGQKIADLYHSNVTRDYKNQPSLTEFVSISVSISVYMSAPMSGPSGPWPLPGNPFPTGTPAHKAYTTCVTLENSFPLANLSGPSTLVCARLLGYLILHAPTPGGQTCIVNEINSCNNDEKLHGLAQFYVNYFLRVCE